MSLANSEVAKRWSKGRPGNGSNLQSRPPWLQSYSTYIALQREGRPALHNGDNFSVSTGRHQFYGRSYSPGPIIPFSALERFGIREEQLHKLEDIKTTPDKSWYECSICHKQDSPENYPAPTCCDKKMGRRHRLESYVFKYHQPDHFTCSQCSQHGDFQWDHRNYKGSWSDPEGTLHEAKNMVCTPAHDRYFIGAWDEQERWGRCYFVTELVRPVTSYADALEALKPAEVLKAEADGIEVRRQGDLFFIKTIQLAKGKANAKALMGLRHIASRYEEVGGNHYASGVVRHTGGTTRRRWSGGGPEHAPLHLLPHWWKVVPNTSTAAGLATGKAMSYSMGGGVD